MYIGSFKAGRLTLKGSQKSECMITLGSVAVGDEDEAVAAEAEARATAAAGMVTGVGAGDASTAATRAGWARKTGQLRDMWPVWRQRKHAPIFQRQSRSSGINRTIFLVASVLTGV